MTHSLDPPKAEMPALDIKSILRILPHRYPFLLIDRIVSMTAGDSLVAIKNVSANEPYFQGHFPGQPVMPGVLMIEAMAQAGGMLLLHSIERPETKLMYLGAVENARFRRQVVPGDQVRIEMKLLRFRLGSCKLEGRAFVGEALAAEATLLATLGDREGEPSR